jgi:predicted nuclease of predicted toxin-antitoxin system
MDVGVGKLSEHWLADHGHDVVAVRNLNPAMDDDEILAIAVTEQRLVITMDKGFGERVIRHEAANAGVLLLRLDEANSREKVAVIAKIFSEHDQELLGNFSVYKNGRLRIHPRRKWLVMQSWYTSLLMSCSWKITLKSIAIKVIDDTQVTMKVPA